MLRDPTMFDDHEAVNTSAAQPLHIQHLEASLNMDHFIGSTQNLLNRSLSSDEDHGNDANDNHSDDSDPEFYSYAATKTANDFSRRPTVGTMPGLFDMQMEYSISSDTNT